MPQHEMLTGHCPKCGEDLQIPAHLQEFSCLYCGTRLTPDQIRTQQAAVGSPNREDSAAYYREHVLETITNHIGIEQELSGSRYPAAMDAYEASNAATFRHLDWAVAAGAMTLDEAVTWYLDQISLRWDSIGSRNLRNKTMESDKFIIAIFLVPMVRRMKLPISEAFCTILQKHWVQRYPKSPFYLGTYEELCGGFQKKFLGLCYITTAICSHDGKPDDCEELTAFRSFRDGYLRSCPDGPALISRYYERAPWIVFKIELSEHRDTIYRTIRDRYLLPCYADLQAGHLRACKERYTAMVHALEQEYLS